MGRWFASCSKDCTRTAISPAFAGVLLTTPFTGLPLVVCGVLKIVYDVALLVSFRDMKPPEERARE